VSPGSSSANVSVTLKSQGSATISIAQPAGFTTPNSFTTANVTVN
jgi:hypothetical protein